MMNIKIVVADNCPACIRVESIIKEFINKSANVDLKIININDCKECVAIVPALYINNNLISYGEISESKFSEYLKSA